MYFGVNILGMNLIIVDQLSRIPPNDNLAIRYILMQSAIEYKIHPIVEVKKEEKDFYYKTLKTYGLFDFIEDIITPEEREEGIRLDVEYNYPLTIKLNKICFENTHEIVRQIEMLARVQKNT